MSQLIPLPSGNPFFDVQATLENITYTLQFRWNARTNGWFMNVLDESGLNTLVAGMRCVVWFPLAAYRIDRQPPGAFFFDDTATDGQEPQLNDLGTRVLLRYFTSAELGL